jgi:hypothetical protein
MIWVEVGLLLSLPCVTVALYLYLAAWGAWLGYWRRGDGGVWEVRRDVE